MGESGIIREHETEEALASALAEGAWTGIFSGGKQIVRTELQGIGPRRTLALYFNDNSAFAITGDFEIRYKEPMAQQPARIEDVVEGRVLSEEDMGSV
jgi:hypothetical protein